MDDTVLNLAVIGGGAAGYFAALRAASVSPGIRVSIFENNRRPLEKVRISGGGRCNVTHHCFDPALLIQNYPRGSKELRSAFHRFQPQDMLCWLADRGVELKTEQDGRMFPISDQSASIIDCFEAERLKLGVQLITNCKVEMLRKADAGKFKLRLSTDPDHQVSADTVLLATGNHISGHAFARELGHTVTPLAPSLFTLNVRDAELNNLSGISVPQVALDLYIHGEKIQSSSGPLLITHWGISGPAVLKLSAWAARELHAAMYAGTLRVNWSGGLMTEELLHELAATQKQSPRKTVLRSPHCGLSARLWEYLLRTSLPEVCERPWERISKTEMQRISAAITAYELPFDGKGQFKEEFVTCGGVALNEIDFRSMESKRVSGLFLAGEVLDIDGITGGFNFQSAWTAGWIAGSAIAMRIGG